MSTSEVVPIESVGQKIFIIRGVKVMIDADLAELYQVSTKYLNQIVRRNADRFPDDFMFQLNRKELDSLRLQFATTKGQGGRRYLPLVFTEHGVAMLSAVLRSKRAVEMSVFIVRAFIKLRELLATNKEMAQKVDQLEKDQQKYGEQITAIHDFLRRLTASPEKPKEKMGFKAPNS